jgi:hypothetical protein
MMERSSSIGRGALFIGAVVDEGPGLQPGLFKVRNCELKRVMKKVFGA